jgi:NAD(P)-dependent dehydrogenase (short-subunit alcohol dehydrogenase family)
MGKLEGKVALITGGSIGIGFAAARRFVAEGAHVFITGRRQAELDAAVAELGGNATAVRGDVSKLADLDRLVATIRSTKGRLDIVFANAGIAERAPIAEVTEEAFDRMFDINVKGALFTVQQALPLLRDGGTIILSSSVVGSKGIPNTSVYSATKAALRSFARTFASELRARQIRVNVVSPGPIDTPGLRGLNDGADADRLAQAYNANVPLGRLGRVDEIANAVLFLASDEASYVNGSELFVDGGMAQI